MDNSGAVLRAARETGSSGLEPVERDSIWIDNGCLPGMLTMITLGKYEYLCNTNIFVVLSLYYESAVCSFRFQAGKLPA